MILVRAWMRQALGASGAALVVPITMVGVLVLLTLAGGLGRIGNIGQAFSGPRLRAPAVPAPSGGANGRSPLLLALTGRGTAGSQAGGRGRAGQAGASNGRPAPGSGSVGSGGPFAHSGPGGPGRGSGGPGGPAGTPAGGGGSAATPPSSAPPVPPHKPSPGPSLISRVTSQLPTPAGPAASQTIESVGATAARIAPLPSPVSVHPPSQSTALAAALVSVR
jgi:hypothetical protein